MNYLNTFSGIALVLGSGRVFWVQEGVPALLEPKSVRMSHKLGAQQAVPVRTSVAVSCVPCSLTCAAAWLGLWATIPVPAAIAVPCRAETSGHPRPASPCPGRPRASLPHHRVLLIPIAPGPPRVPHTIQNTCVAPCPCPPCPPCLPFSLPPQILFADAAARLGPGGPGRCQGRGRATGAAADGQPARAGGAGSAGAPPGASGARGKTADGRRRRRWERRREGGRAGRSGEGVASAPLAAASRAEPCRAVLCWPSLCFSVTWWVADTAPSSVARRIHFPTHS